MQCLRNAQYDGTNFGSAYVQLLPRWSTLPHLAATINHLLWEDGKPQRLIPFQTDTQNGAEGLR